MPFPEARASLNVCAPIPGRRPPSRGAGPGLLRLGLQPDVADVGAAGLALRLGGGPPQGPLHGHDVQQDDLQGGGQDDAGDRKVEGQRRV